MNDVQQDRQVSPELRSEVNKRMTMNMLIQGAAWQACLSGHHLVKDELDQLSPNCNRKISNTEFYDRFSTAALIGQWNSELALFTGMSSLFWNRVGTGKTDFCQHPLLSRHGKSLAKQSKSKSLQRGREKHVWGQPVALSLQTASLLLRLTEFEVLNRRALEKLAIKATAAIWGLPESQLTAELTENPEFGEIRTPDTKSGKKLRTLMVAWGGVAQKDDGTMQVIGRSKFWSLLLHELTKGAVELISLHGLNELDDETYSQVMLAADNIEYEVWMMQSGLELYRKLLQVLPRGFPIAKALMYIAKMPAPLHEQFSLAVVEEPNRASDFFLDFAGRPR